MAEKNKTTRAQRLQSHESTNAHNSAAPSEEDERLFRQGLYSGYFYASGNDAACAFTNNKNNDPNALNPANQPREPLPSDQLPNSKNAPQTSGLLCINKLADYIPMALLFWALAYVILTFDFIRPLQRPLMGILLIFTALATLGAIILYRRQPFLGPWPANRAASFILLMLVLDFWVWVFNRPYSGISSFIYLSIDIFAFTALMFAIYMFIYKRLHIEAVIKLFMVKAFFDFAAYVLSGGFGLALLNRIGINHPLHIDAIFTIAMLELWILLLYILKYRNKITQLPQ